jgi:hypothetical protein
MRVRFLTLLLVLVPSVALAAEIKHTRGNVVLDTITTPDDPIEAAAVIRARIKTVRDQIRSTDVLLCKGEADFGKYYAFYLPSCIYRGDGTAHWITRCKIDGTKDSAGNPTKALATPGFVLPAYSRFENFKLSGKCAYPAQDGAVTGWASDAEFDGLVEFIDCEVDAHAGADWGAVYTWENKKWKRRIVVKGTSKAGEPKTSIIRYCRLGIAAAGSGNPLQFIEVSNTAFIGDANGSKSWGATSRGDRSPKVMDGEVNGGVLAAVLNRAGETILRDCTFTAKGLEKQYYRNDWKPGVYLRVGVYRIANFGTDQYSDNPGKTTWTMERCKSLGITPGVATVWNDIDLRGTNAVETLKLVGVADTAGAAQQNGAKAVADANAKFPPDLRAKLGGSNEDGTIKVWTDPARSSKP